MRRSLNTWRKENWPFLMFTATIVGLACCWLIALPLLGHWGPIREIIERNQAAGIDASAMFYTELGRVQGVELIEENGKRRLVNFEMNDR